MIRKSSKGPALSFEERMKQEVEVDEKYAISINNFM